MPESEPPSAARIAMTDDAVLAVLRQYFGGLDAMHLWPSVPGAKELVARALHGDHLPSHERILTLFDDGVFGSGDEGFLITARRICWKNPHGPAQMVEWQDIDPQHVYADGRRLALGLSTIELTGDEAVIDACEAAIHVLAFSARTAGAAGERSGVVAVPVADDEDSDESERPTHRPAPAPTPLATPAAHAVTYDSYVTHAASQRGPSFACWHCHTPLHWNTPQCARCSAKPAPQGWQRTA